MTATQRVRELTENTRVSVPTTAAWSLAVGLVMFGAGSVLARNTILADAKALVVEASTAQRQDTANRFLTIEAFREWQLDDQAARAAESRKRDQQYFQLLLEIRRNRR